MKMQNVLLMMLFVVASNNAIAEKWVEIVNDGEGIVLSADLDSIQKEKNFVKMKSKFEMPSLSDRSLKDITLQLHEFDCIKKKFRPLLPQERNWESKSANPTAGKMWDLACKK